MSLEMVTKFWIFNTLPRLFLNLLVEIKGLYLTNKCLLKWEGMLARELRDLDYSA